MDHTTTIFAWIVDDAGSPIMEATRVRSSIDANAPTDRPPPDPYLRCLQFLGKSSAFTHLFHGRRGKRTPTVTYVRARGRCFLALRFNSNDFSKKKV